MDRCTPGKGGQLVEMCVAALVPGCPLAGAGHAIEELALVKPQNKSHSKERNRIQMDGKESLRS